MGTWGYRLSENDTFCEVVEWFQKQVLLAESVEVLRAECLERYKDALDYILVQEAVVECLWRLNKHKERDIEIIQNIIDTETDDAFWADLEADQSFLRHRKAEMKRFLDRISRNPTDVERWKLNAKPECALRKGNCFWYKSNGSYYGAVVLEVQESDCAYYLIALSEAVDSTPRNQEQVLALPLYTIAWFPSMELLNQRRIHFLADVKIGKGYLNKYGIRIEPDGTLQMTNVGQAATWKHGFRAIRFHEAILNDFV